MKTFNHILARPLLLASLLSLSACGPEVVRFQPQDMGTDADQSEQDEGGEDAEPDTDEGTQDLGTDLGDDDGVDMEADLGPCGQTCQDPTPVCDASKAECVQCVAAQDCQNGQVCQPEGGACVDCLGDQDCQGEQVCDVAQSLCVECVENTQCATAAASLCQADNTCGACTQDDDCAHVQDRPVCEQGVCFECSLATEEERCGANSCDPQLNRCTDTERGSLEVCEPCRADSDCAEGACVAYKPSNSSIPQGRYCLPVGDCEGAFAKPGGLVDSVSGQSVRLCTPTSNMSCEAVRDALDFKPCPEADEKQVSDACGQMDGKDGVCVPRSTGVQCSITCRMQDDCPSRDFCQDTGFSTTFTVQDGYCTDVFILP